MGSPTKNRSFRNSRKMRKLSRAARASGKSKGTNCQKTRSSVIFCMARSYKRKDYGALCDTMSQTKWSGK